MDSLCRTEERKCFILKARLLRTQTEVSVLYVAIMRTAELCDRTEPGSPEIRNLATYGKSSLGQQSSTKRQVISKADA